MSNQKPVTSNQNKNTKKIFLVTPYLLFATLMWLILSAGSNVALAAPESAWITPIGIPEPPFGITTTHMMYADPSYTYDYGSGPEPYRIGPNGPYTHYVDPERSNATDVGNEYGTYDLPRKNINIYTLPSLPAGSVVELHNVEWTQTSSLQGNGTAELPIFIRGIVGEEPTVTAKQINVDCSYIIFENIEFDLTDASPFPSFRFATDGNSVTNIAIRNCEFYGGSALIGNRGPRAMFIKNNVVGASGTLTNIVVYDNYFHNIGDDRPLGYSGDSMGVSVDANARNVWIVDNYFHHIGGDSIQVAFDEDDPDPPLIPNHIYIGRNKFHDMSENAVDLKESTDVILSQNVAYNFGYYTPLRGVAIANSFPFRYGPQDRVQSQGKERIWTIFNEVYNSSSADGAFHLRSNVGVLNPEADEIYYIGNIVHDCHSSSGDAAAYKNYYNQRIYYLNNVAYNCDIGGEFFGITNLIPDPSNPDDPQEQLVLINNIFGERASGGWYNLAIWGGENYLRDMIVYNNLLYESSGEEVIHYVLWDGVWQTPIDYNLADFEIAYPNQTENNVEGNPLHIDAANGEFQLQGSSPAIDAGTSSGVVQQVFDRFEQLYGIDIRKDIEGGVRPYGAEWDIGAYEYGSSPLKGDVNGDGLVNIQDVQCCVNHISGKQDWGSDADVNKDGKVDESDVEEIIDIILGE